VDLKTDAKGAILLSWNEVKAPMNEEKSLQEGSDLENAAKDPFRILVIDDDAELCDLLLEYLQAESFTVSLAHDGPQGLEAALAGEADLVVLDVMLPGINGFEVLRRIRTRSTVPVIMLTARGEDVDRIVGLEIGADDYLAKPFNPRELVARIRAILRRTSSETMGASAPAHRRMQFGDVEMDLSSRIVRVQGSPLNLTTAEFDILASLLRAPGIVVSRENLVQQVLGRTFIPYDRSVDVHISNLRRKLGRYRDGSERIKSIRGVGYIYASQGGPEG
jgi:DNA-binding response OmpR family regulator